MSTLRLFFRADRPRANGTFQSIFGAMRKQIINFLPKEAKQFLRSLVIPPLRGYFRYFPLSLGKRSVWGHVAAHLWWLESYVNAKTVFGSVLRVDARDIGGRYLYYFGIWEPNLTKWIAERLGPGDTFVDVGANVGYYSLLAARVAARVVAIEAVPRTYAILKENLAANQALNVRPVNVAVWDRQEHLTMFVAQDKVTGTSTLMSKWAEQWHLVGRCEVPAAPLSALLEPEELRSLRLIKIDVEGAEWHVVSGMASVLENGREDLEVIIEVAHGMLEAEGKDGRELISLFERCGFHPYRVENDYSVSSHMSKEVKRPQRIKSIPVDTDQVDLIFSRVDAASL
jgi:FkbM family methyltransferase